MSKKKFSSGINGKGYYIALVLCAVAIGITGFLYYRNADDANATLKNPPASAGEVGATNRDDVQAVATQPNGGDGATTPHLRRQAGAEAGEHEAACGGQDRGGVFYGCSEL